MHILYQNVIFMFTAAVSYLACVKCVCTALTRVKVGGVLLSSAETEMRPLSYAMSKSDLRLFCMPAQSKKKRRRNKQKHSAAVRQNDVHVRFEGLYQHWNRKGLIILSAKEVKTHWRDSFIIPCTMVKKIKINKNAEKRLLGQEKNPSPAMSTGMEMVLLRVGTDAPSFPCSPPVHKPQMQHPININDRLTLNFVISTETVT